MRMYTTVFRALSQKFPIFGMFSPQELVLIVAVSSTFWGGANFAHIFYSMDAEIQVVCHTVKQKNALFLFRRQPSDSAEQGAPIWHLKPRSLMVLAY